MTAPHLPCHCTLALTVPEFCAAVKIARTTFYALQEAGTGPVTFKAGRRTLVSVEAARAWITLREGNQVAQ